MYRYLSYPLSNHSETMNKSWHSRRKFLATGATLTGAAIAGCIGAPASGETNPEGGSPEDGEITIQSVEEDIEEPTGGSELAGSVGGGEPDWVDAHNMRFRGWYYVPDYDHRVSDWVPLLYGGEPNETNAARRGMTLVLLNYGGYVVEATVTDDDGYKLYNWTLPLGYGRWFNDRNAKNAEIRVVGSAQSEALNIDLTKSTDHVVWLGGAVLTAHYWIGHW